MAIKWKQGYVRVFSRHPSHNPLRNAIKTLGKRVILRLGSVTSPNYMPDIEINTVESIENTKNKYTMKKLFQSAGVHSPNFYPLFNTHAGHWVDGEFKHISFKDLSNILPYPVLAKKTYRSRGMGMMKLNNQEEFLEFIEEKVTNNRRHEANPYYLEEFKNYIKEYRIHVSELGNYFYTCRKVLRQEFAGTDNNWYRNDANSNWLLESNEAFDKPDNWDDIVKDCQKARETLGLSICAMDVKVTKDGRWAILEANSAPSFGDVTVEKYLLEITKIIFSKNN
jgi:D-alanine-D-alanine ligase-like ATP-grasp enzyme